MDSPRQRGQRLLTAAARGEEASCEEEGLGAGDGIRTRDILLGKQTLCQLSYSRSGGRHSRSGGAALASRGASVAGERRTRESPGIGRRRAPHRESPGIGRRRAPRST